MKCAFFSPMAMNFSSGRGFFLALSADGHAGGPRVHYGASVAPRRSVAYAGRSKPGELARNHRIAFRRARAKQDHGNPKISTVYSSCYCITLSFQLSSFPAMVQQQSHIEVSPL